MSFCGIGIQNAMLYTQKFCGFAILVLTLEINRNAKILSSGQSKISFTQVKREPSKPFKNAFTVPHNRL